MHRAQRSVQFAQNPQAFRSDARFHDATIFLLPFARDQAAGLEAIEQARDIGIVRDHAPADFPARQTRRASTSQDAEDIELGIRQIKRLQDLFRIAHQRTVQPKQVEKNLLLKRLRR
jgi:hypothetical protein